MNGGAITIEFDGEVVAKGRPRFAVGPRGRMIYTPARTRNYEHALKLAAKAVMGNRAPLEGALQIVVTVFSEIPKSWSSRKLAQALAGLIRPTTKPDWDNLGKTAADALNEVVYLDDKQIVDGTVHKFYSDRPRLVVTIAPYHKAHGNVSTSDVLV